MELLAGTQNLNATQKSIADCLGLNQSQVTIRCRRIGGGFGGKEGIFEYSCCAAIAANKLQRQVSLVLDHRDDIMYTGKRHESLVRGDLYVDINTKKFLFFDVQAYLDGGYATDLSPAVLERLVYHLDQSYHFESTRFVGRACKTNLRSNTAFRGFGAPQAVYFTEMMIQDVAKEMNWCENTLREVNLYQPCDRTPYGQLVGEIPLQECIDQVIEKSNYGKIKQEVKDFNATHTNLQQGVALMPLKFGVSFAQSFLNQGHALVHVFTDGSVSVSHGGVEMGQGLHTKIRQVAAEEFGIPLELVKVRETSTESTANTAPTSASSGYDLNAGAVKDACKQIKENIKDYYSKFQSGEISWKDCCNQAWFGRCRLSAAGHYKHPIPGFNFTTQTGQPFYYYACSAIVIRVMVDKLTGLSQVLKAELVVDVGQSINP